MRYIYTILCFFTSQYLFAQNSNDDDFSNIVHQQDSLRKAFEELFRNKQYGSIIEIGNNLSNYTLKRDVDFNLIAAYYMLGDTAFSRELLMRKLNLFKENPKNVVSIISKSQYGFRKYLQEPGNKKFILDFALSQYAKETLSEPEISLALFNCFITDQVIRNELSDRQTDKVEAKNENDTIFDVENGLNLQKQFNIYQKSNRLFNEKEIGTLFRMQFLLLAHEANPERRAFYQTLVEKAVYDGLCSKVLLMNFILRTEMINKGQKQFFKDLPKRTEEMQKEYDEPNYRFGVF